MYDAAVRPDPSVPKLQLSSHGSTTVVGVFQFLPQILTPTSCHRL